VEATHAARRPRRRAARRGPGHCSP
jgi:hypothetical protein